MSARIGKIISHYRILRPVDVDRDAYVAEDMRVNQEVVIKFLSSGLNLDAADLRRLDAVIEGTTKLEESDGQRFIVVEPKAADALLRALQDTGQQETQPPDQRAASAHANKTTIAASESDAPTGPLSDFTASLSPGQILGERYRIGVQLGRGGMGEVWQAFDLKLQVEVALKSSRHDRFTDEKALDLLRSEVRAAREVISPNVCRIFDLVIEDELELVSMEYVDGSTLTDILQTRGPLELHEARTIASQFLAGLEAIHQAELVHRDIKPENIMITLSGRVVIMDFGIAKGVTEDRSGTISGTPAYMAPEQMRGAQPSARADIFSAGIVLAEMTAAGIRTRSTREKIWRGVREKPPLLPDGPWKDVLLRSVAADPARRHASAIALVRALEEVTLRVEGAEDKRPYPGLASFTEHDAEYFFGREAEIEGLWKKLRRAHLLAVIGPSGAGKTSFLQAGLVPSQPDDWCHIRCHPGPKPYVALGQALALELAGDAAAVRDLLRIDEPGVAVSLFKRWRERHGQVLLIVDQFEELFTLNPDEVQAQFAQLLGELVIDADVHVLLAMRDDFLFHCHAHPALSPILSELTLLGPPTGASLRRALVQPALSLGYRLEDESLVSEMLSEVRDERGALPLLAFAAASLWERRDRESGTLTRQAYEEIGGVGGALAKHAEATLESIGADRQPIVREIFRNLVTSQGTRAIRDTRDLLSVFDDAAPPREVLRQLVDARLLTSFDVSDRDETSSTRQQVEIIHESLLTAWPRLRRWQTQDSEGAQLRDQLRQAAQLWAERERSDDLLWTGTAFQEFELWRERYPGGLSSTEEDFAQDMTEKVQRQIRRKRRFVGSAFTALVGVLAVVGLFWHRSVQDARRAEASNLFALGRIELAENRTLTVAYAIASLELADDPAVRRLALEALWRGPLAFVLPDGLDSWPTTTDFSPDGHSLVCSYADGSITIWPANGGEPKALRDPSLDPCDGCGLGYPQFGPDGETFTGQFFSQDKKLRYWSTHADEPLSALELTGAAAHARLSGDRRRLVTQSEMEGSAEGGLLQVWALEPTSLRLVGRRFVTGFPHLGKTPWMSTQAGLDPTGEWLAYAKGHAVELVPVANMETAIPQLVGRHNAEIVELGFHPEGARIVAADRSGEIRVWSRTAPTPNRPLRVMKFPSGSVYGAPGFDRDGKWLATPQGELPTLVWDLAGPPERQPLELEWPGNKLCAAFHPGGEWIAVAGDSGGTTLWPLTRSYPKVIAKLQFIEHVEFGPDGTWIVSASDDGSVRLWSLESGAAEESRVVARWDDALWNVVVDPEARFLVTSGHASVLRVVGLHDGSERVLPTPPSPTVASGMDIDPTGRHLAVGFRGSEDRSEHVTRVYDLETDNFHKLDAGDGLAIGVVKFLRDGRLLVSSRGNLRVWDVPNQRHELLMENIGGFALSRDERYMLSHRQGRAVFHDLQEKTSRELTSHGNRVVRSALDATGRLAVTADENGVIRVGPVTGEEPHLLLGHKGGISAVKVHPDGRWVASASFEDEEAIRLWPVPEGTPLHTLSREAFLERLRSLTNIRVVRDDDSPNGYRIDYAPFQGWQERPTW